MTNKNTFRSDKQKGQTLLGSITVGCETLPMTLARLTFTALSDFVDNPDV